MVASVSPFSASMSATSPLTGSCEDSVMGIGQKTPEAV